MDTHRHVGILSQPWVGTVSVVSLMWVGLGQHEHQDPKAETPAVPPWLHTEQECLSQSHNCPISLGITK